MIKNILDIIPPNYKNYKIKKIDKEASGREYYRLFKNKRSFILMDSSKEKDAFFDFLKIYKILSKVNISIPQVYEIDEKRKIIILEDFGSLRFDKIINNYDIKKLLSVAVDSLIVLKKEILYDIQYKLPIYNYNIFKKEIAEFLDFYYPFYKKENIPLDLREDFFNEWESYYNSLNLNFTSFTHKDYNLNNLFYLPQKQKHYKCGIIDFQNAFWGEESWDLFSLLEDSRIYFNDEYNEYFINYFFSKFQLIDTIQIFKEKYHFFNCSRQTRLLGRWVKLSKNLDNKFYLNFINVTNKRLVKSLQKLSNKKLMIFYQKLFPELYVH